jgi:Flp pilus assembly protein CpaB
VPHRPAPDRLLRAAARHRRLLAALCVAAAVAVGLPVVAPPPPRVDHVLVASRDLPSGRVLTADDVTWARWPVGSSPAGALLDVAGRVTAAGMRRGEPLTDARVLGSRLLEGAPAGTLGVTVRPADPAALLLLRPGERVTVLAGSAPGDPAAAGTAGVVVPSALVLAVPGSGGQPAGAPDGDPGAGGLLGSVTGSGGEDASRGVVVLAVAPGEAERLAAAAGTRSLTVALRAPSG